MEPTLNDQQGKPPNGSRLSCGALKKKYSSLESTRAASFKRLLGGCRARAKTSTDEPHEECLIIGVGKGAAGEDRDVARSVKEIDEVRVLAPRTVERPGQVRIDTCGPKMDSLV